MTGEYSRELSAKVFAGQCRLIELGFRQGGSPGYGLRRVLVDQNGLMKTELQRGDTFVFDAGYGQLEMNEVSYSCRSNLGAQAGSGDQRVAVSGGG
jgi:hypothetical protein